MGEIIKKIQELYGLLVKETKRVEECNTRITVAQGDLKIKQESLLVMTQDLQTREKETAKVENVIEMDKANQREKSALDQRKKELGAEIQAVKDYEGRAIDDYKVKLADIATQKAELEKREKALEDGIKKLEEDTKTLKAKILKDVQDKLK